MFDLGTGGVKVGEPDREGIVEPDKNGVIHDDPKEETHDNEITDNHIHEAGRVFHAGHGIMVLQSYNNLIAHNEVNDLYYSGISIGWSWKTGKCLATGNIIEYNHVHHLGQGVLSDFGAIYTLGRMPGTVIRYNLLHDTEHAAYVGRGIYLDGRSSEILVEKNITYRTSTGGYGQSAGIKNIVRNNIFAYGRDCQFEPNGGMPKMNPPNSLLYERNIVYFKPEQKLLRMKWNDTEVVTRSNLYWQEGGGEIKFGEVTWSEWQARGMDQGSLVADPLFVDPEKGDFRLKPNSPALKVGFEPFDLSTVGPRR